MIKKSRDNSGKGIWMEETVLYRCDEDEWHFDPACQGYAYKDWTLVTRGEAENLGKEPCGECAAIYKLP